MIGNLHILLRVCHSGLPVPDVWVSGIFLCFSEGFPARFACGNDSQLNTDIIPAIVRHYIEAG